MIDLESYCAAEEVNENTGCLEQDIAEMDQHSDMIDRMADTAEIAINQAISLQEASNLSVAQSIDANMSNMAAIESFKCIDHMIDRALSQVGILNKKANFESYGRKGLISEGFSERAKEIVDKIALFIKQLAMKFVDWIKSFFNSAKGIQKLCKDVSKLASECKDKKDLDNLTVKLSRHEVKWLTRTGAKTVDPHTLANGVEENTKASESLESIVHFVNANLKDVLFTIKIPGFDQAIPANRVDPRMKDDTKDLYRKFLDHRLTRFPLGDSVIEIKSNIELQVATINIVGSSFKPEDLSVKIVTPVNAESIATHIEMHVKRFEDDKIINELSKNLETFTAKLKEYSKEHGTMTDHELLAGIKMIQGQTFMAINLYRTIRNYMLKSYKATLIYCKQSMLAISKT